MALESFQEQKDFYTSQKESMEAANADNGVKGIVDFINGIDDELERRVLYIFARQGLIIGKNENKDFDTYIQICEAGIDEMSGQLENESDPEERTRKIRGLHVLSYNLAADLADCWPGDNAVRSRKHFERGLKAANDCLNWAEMNNSPASVFSIDFWAKGMHEFSLAKYEESSDSWKRSFELACKVEGLDELPEKVETENSFGIILGAGYRGLALMAMSDPSGEGFYANAIAAFMTQLDIEDKKDDAQFGIDQLETVRKKYLS